MSIAKEKVLKNAKKFHETGLKYEFVNDELMELLGEEFTSAPACSTLNLYNAHEGGLIQFILTITKYAVSVNELLPEDKKVNVKSLVRVCCLHQIGKAKMFVEQKSQWHKDNKGEMFIFNNDLLSMSVAERSIYYAMTAGIKLSEDEVFAIFNYNSDFAARPLKSEGEKLASILRVASMIAVIESK
jgi:hypothetical protein